MLLHMSFEERHIRLLWECCCDLRMAVEGLKLDRTKQAMQIEWMMTVLKDAATALKAPKAMKAMNAPKAMKAMKAPKAMTAMKATKAMKTMRTSKSGAISALAESTGLKPEDVKAAIEGLLKKAQKKALNFKKAPKAKKAMDAIRTNKAGAMTRLSIEDY